MLYKFTRDGRWPTPDDRASGLWTLAVQLWAQRSSVRCDAAVVDRPFVGTVRKRHGRICLLLDWNRLIAGLETLDHDHDHDHDHDLYSG